MLAGRTPHQEGFTTLARDVMDLAGPESLRSIRPRNIGARTPRVEDDRLLAGHARFVADLRPDGLLDVAVVRSQMPHARIRVDVEPARRARGVIAAVTSADLDGVTTMPEFVDWARPVGRSILAVDRVRYVGAPIAAVVAADRYLAEDAAELVDVDYDPLPAVASLEDALAADAMPLFDGWA